MNQTVGEQLALERLARKDERDLKFLRHSPPEQRALPRWVNWLAAVLIFGGLAVLEYQDAQVEQSIQQARK